MEMKSTESFTLEVCSFLSIPVVFFTECLAKLRSKKIDRWGGGTVEVTSAELLYILTRFKKPNIILEAGTNHGFSTSHLAMGATDSEIDFSLFTIDLQDASVAKQKLKDLGVFDNVCFLNGDSVENFMKIAKREVIDFCFIDSSHDYEHTKKEFNAIKDSISEKAIITFHDAYTERYGVKRFIEELDSNRWDSIILPTQENNGFGIVVER